MDSSARAMRMWPAAPLDVMASCRSGSDVEGVTTTGMAAVPGGAAGSGDPAGATSPGACAVTSTLPPLPDTGLSTFDSPGRAETACSVDRFEAKESAIKTSGAATKIAATVHNTCLHGIVDAARGGGADGGDGRGGRCIAC